jgi:hypothetical protein
MLAKLFHVLELYTTMGVFGWAVAFGNAVVSCGLWKSCCEKPTVGKAEDCLVTTAVSCGNNMLWMKYL